MNEIDIAWLAGLLEGEGTFLIESTRWGKTAIRCTLSMSDKDIVERAAQIVGKPEIVYMETVRDGHKQLYRLGISGYRAASVMRAILPHMGKRRSKRILEVLEAWDAVARTRERRLAPTCHPDKKHYAKGLCTECYRRSRYDPSIQFADPVTA